MRDYRGFVSPARDRYSTATCAGRRLTHGPGVFQQNPPSADVETLTLIKVYRAPQTPFLHGDPGQKGDCVCADLPRHASIATNPPSATSGRAMARRSDPVKQPLFLDGLLHLSATRGIGSGRLVRWGCSGFCGHLLQGSIQVPQPLRFLSQPVRFTSLAVITLRGYAANVVQSGAGSAPWLRPASCAKASFVSRLAVQTAPLATRPSSRCRRVRHGLRRGGCEPGRSGTPRRQSCI